MIDERFVLLGVLLQVFGVWGYLRDTIRGTTTPNRVTWSIWTVAPFLAFFAQLREGVTWQATITFTAGFFPLLVLIASFANKNATWKFTSLDKVCGFLSVLGLVLWQITQKGNVAIFFGILADGLAAVPTIVKSFREPESESHGVFLTGIAYSGITMLTIKDWDFAHVAFPAYIFGLCVLLTSLIAFRIGPRFGLRSERLAE